MAITQDLIVDIPMFGDIPATNEAAIYNAGEEHGFGNLVDSIKALRENNDEQVRIKGEGYYDRFVILINQVICANTPEEKEQIMSSFEEEVLTA